MNNYLINNGLLSLKIVQLQEKYSPNIQVSPMGPGVLIFRRSVRIIIPSGKNYPNGSSCFHIVWCPFRGLKWALYYLKTLPYLRDMLKESPEATTISKRPSKMYRGCTVNLQCNIKESYGTGFELGFPREYIPFITRDNPSSVTTRKASSGGPLKLLEWVCQKLVSIRVETTFPQCLGLQHPAKWSKQLLVQYGWCKLKIKRIIQCRTFWIRRWGDHVLTTRCTCFTIFKIISAMDI